MKKFNIIACVNLINGLGFNNHLLYHIPTDLKNFKRLTTKNIVIMGRKTFESLPYKRVLPNRINVIITKDKDYKVDNGIVVHSIEEAISFCETPTFKDLECFVIGGGSIYQSFLDKGIVDKIFLTKVDCVDNADTIFSNEYMDEDKWRLIFQSDSNCISDESHESLCYTFNIYKRI